MKVSVIFDAGRQDYFSPAEGTLHYLPLFASPHFLSSLNG